MTHRLGSVVGVDMDVVFGQIAGPESRASLPFSGDAEDNRNICIVKAHFHVAFVEGAGQTGAADFDVLEGDVDGSRVEVHSGVSGGGEDAAPVGIGSGNRCFYER